MTAVSQRQGPRQSPGQSPAQLREALKPPSADGWGSGLLMATVIHVALVIALAFGVSWRSSPPETVQAELWASVPVAAAPRAVDPPPPPPPAAPPPVPRPTPTPPKAVEPPPVQRDAEIALEQRRKEQAAREERDAREREKKRERELAEAREREQARQREEARREKERREAADRERREEQRAQQQRREQQAKRQADDATAAEAQRQANLQRTLGMAGASGAPDARGQAAQSAGPSSSYAGRIRAAIRPNIVFPDAISGNPVAEVEVRAGPSGTVIGRTLVRSSGVREWDEAVLRAIDRTETLPRDVDGRVPSSMILSFRPRD